MKERGGPIIIIGGAIAMLASYELAEAGQDVVLVTRRRHSEPINKRGLQVIDENGQRHETRKIRATPSMETAAVGDRPAMVIVAVKSFDTDSVLADVLRACGSDTPIVCAQNGVRNESRAASMFGQVWGAAITFGADQSSPGAVKARSSARSIVLGKVKDETAGDVGVADQLGTGLQVETVGDIMGVKRGKAIGNAASSVGAILDLTWKEISESAVAFEMAERVKEEGKNAFARLGLSCIDPFDDKPGQLPFIYTQATKGSTWFALQNGLGQVETQFFNGEVVTAGVDAGIPTPANYVMLHITLQMAKHGIEPGAINPAALSRKISAAEKAVSIGKES